jgi:hypothetical protein
MRLSSKTLSALLILALLGAVVGGLAWEVADRICQRFGIVLGMSVGPIGFDLSVISVRFLVNPGTVLGLMGGIALFFFL